MSAWILFLIISLVFLIIELFTSTLFFLNFAASALVCVIASLYTQDYRILTPVFVIISLILIYLLRPLYKKNTIEDNDFKDQYLNKEAVAIEDISTKKGRIKIYDETWLARLSNNQAETIKKGQLVKIIEQKDLTMYVELL